MHHRQTATNTNSPPTAVALLLTFLFTSLLIVGCSRQQTAEIASPTAPSTTIPAASPTDPPTAVATHTALPPATPTATPTTEPTNSPTPTPSPDLSLADGLILLMPQNTHPFIIKQGQLERLSNQEMVLLGPYASFLNTAVAANGQLFRLATAADGLRTIITTQQGSASPTPFFDDPAYTITKLHGLVDSWLLVSLVPTEPPPGQAAGDLVALPLDGSPSIPIGRDTLFTPLVSPDQRFVLFREEGQTKQWSPQDGTNPLPLPAYSFGQFSPNGRYLALVDQQDTLQLYDFADLTLLATAQLGGYLSPLHVGPIRWNPNSQQLAYVSYEAEGDRWLLQTLSVTGDLVEYENLFDPAFSPDGLQMAARSADPENATNLIIDLQTGHRTPFTPRFGQYTLGEPLIWLDLHQEP